MQRDRGRLRTLARRGENLVRRFRETKYDWLTQSVAASDRAGRWIGANGWSWPLRNVGYGASGASEQTS
jgi:hypothetical protein